MPVTYNFYSLVKLPPPPDEPGVVFRREDGELHGTPAKMLVKFSGIDPDLLLEHYVAKHEMQRKIAGRTYDGTSFDMFFQSKETKLSIHRERSIGLCKSGRRDAKSLIDRLNSDYPKTVRFDYVSFDFQSIRTRVDELHGIWVSGISEPNVDTVAMFGLNVDQSSVYEALKSIGSASSIMIPYESGAGRYLVILSARGSVTFVQPLPEKQCLALLDEMYAGLLAESVRVQESKHAAMERKKRERADAKMAAKKSKN